jgi:hypothetical protein
LNEFFRPQNEVLGMFVDFVPEFLFHVAEGRTVFRQKVPGMPDPSRDLPFQPSKRGYFRSVTLLSIRTNLRGLILFLIESFCSDALCITVHTFPSIGTSDQVLQFILDERRNAEKGREGITTPDDLETPRPCEARCNAGPGR